MKRVNRKNSLSHRLGKKDNPRLISLSILDGVESGRQTLDDLLDTTFETEQRISYKDRRLIYAIVFGVLRWKGRLDWIISRFSKIPLSKIDRPVLNILRIGLYQMIYLDKVPVFAAVNTSVEMSRYHAPAWTVRFVNGVLRNISRKQDQLGFVNPATDPVMALSVNQSFPLWLLKRWEKRYGIEETEKRCVFFNAVPPMTIRANELKLEKDALVRALQPDVESIVPCTYVPSGYRISRFRRSFAELEAFKNGGFQFQDEASQAVALFLAPEPGETILDACAGLGSKTGHMAQIMGNQGRIFATDISGRKLDRLKKEMERLGVSIVSAKTYDWQSCDDPISIPACDRVLVDAPCSGLGVIGRNPDIKWRGTEQDIVRMSGLQKRILNHAARWVKPGGRLIYSVCSSEPEETCSVIAAFLKSNQRFMPDNDTRPVAGNLKPLLSGNGHIETIPHVHLMDGFFSAAFRCKP